MTSYIYVGGLSSETTEADLMTHFSQGGQTIKNTTIVTGRKAAPRGFGFVELDSDEDARTVIDKLNGSELKGRTIKVHEAREPRSRWNGRGHAIGAPTRGRW